MFGDECGVTALSWKSSKIDRVCRSPPAAEVIAVSNAEDEAVLVRLTLAELQGVEVDIKNPWEAVRQVPAVVLTDSKDLYDKMLATEKLMTGKEKRTSIELLALEHNTRTCDTQLRWVHSDAMLANSLTKGNELHQLQLYFDSGCRWRIVHDDKFMSAKKRRAKGQPALDHGSIENYPYVPAPPPAAGTTGT